MRRVVATKIRAPRPDVAGNHEVGMSAKSDPPTPAAERTHFSAPNSGARFWAFAWMFVRGCV
jgi:hypothetical protein